MIVISHSTVTSMTTTVMLARMLTMAVTMLTLIVTLFKSLLTFLVDQCRLLIRMLSKFMMFTTSSFRWWSLQFALMTSNSFFLLTYLFYHIWNMFVLITRIRLFIICLIGNSLIYLLLLDFIETVSDLLFWGLNFDSLNNSWLSFGRLECLYIVCNAINNSIIAWYSSSYIILYSWIYHLYFSLHNFYLFFVSVFYLPFLYHMLI